MAIKLINRTPKITELGANDLILNTKEGTLFYRAENSLFKIEGTLSSLTNSTSNETVATASHALFAVSASHAVNTALTNKSNIFADNQIINNNKELQSKNTSNQLRTLIGLDDNNIVKIAATGQTTALRSSGTIFVTGSLIPDGSGSRDLGSSTNPWKDLHVTTESIKFYDGAGEVGKVSFKRDEGIQIKNESDQLSTLSASLGTFTTRIKSPTGSFDHLDLGSFGTGTINGGSF